MKDPFNNSLEIMITKSMMPKEVWEHRDKVDAGNIIHEYILIKQKKSNLSRSQRDKILAKFERYKVKGIYSDKEINRIQTLISQP